jgi:hypothetical protein
MAVKMSMLVLRTVAPRGLVAVKMEVVCSSETLVSSYRFTRRYYSEDKHRHTYIHTYIRCLEAREEKRNSYSLL